MEPAKQIAENVASVRDRIARAAARSGRRAEAVTLVAVTKYVDSALTASVARAGCLDLGESRPQQLWQKAESWPADCPPPRWHLIGHLQRNKIARTLPHTHLVHSLDSVRLAQAISSWASEHGRVVPALLEVNISGEANKTGILAADAERSYAELLELPGLTIRGLMAMSSLDGGPAQARRDFANVRTLRDQLEQFAPEQTLPDLSLGMSDDYEVAIEEGATIVRVGSALFAGLADD